MEKITLPEPHSPDFIVRYIVQTKVELVKVFNDHWWVHFEGSRESLAFNHKDEPAPFTVGDDVQITFQKVEHHAKPL